MALIKCKECGNEISSSANVCPHCGIKVSITKCPECGAKVSDDLKNCKECGYPINKTSYSNLITENLDKLTGAKSKSYVTFKDLFKNTFKKHSEKELDEVFTCGALNTTPKLNDINPKSASAWVYFKILIFFVIAYIPTYLGYAQYQNNNFLPAMIILAV